MSRKIVLAQTAVVLVGVRGLTLYIWTGGQLVKREGPSGKWLGA